MYTTNSHVWKIEKGKRRQKKSISEKESALWVIFEEKKKTQKNYFLFKSCCRVKCRIA